MNRLVMTKQQKVKKLKPSLIATFDVERNIKKNARVKHLNAIATEFKYHHEISGDECKAPLSVYIFLKYLLKFDNKEEHIF